MAIIKKGQIIAEEKEANSLLQSGFGRRAGEEVLLYPLEAAYLQELSLLQITISGKQAKQKDILSLLKPKKLESKLPSAQEQFEIYSVLRGAGRLVRFSPHSPHYWRVYARGIGREQERAQILIRLVCADWKTSLSSLELELCVARQLRMELVFAFIQKGNVQFVKMSKFSLD
ncbi:MAG: hypothetical protein WC492_00615 [Candidatus Micrarchaeia archaeon]|jgi:tRNA splicing endonuclease